MCYKKGFGVYENGFEIHIFPTTIIGQIQQIYLQSLQKWTRENKQNLFKVNSNVNRKKSPTWF